MLQAQQDLSIVDTHVLGVQTQNCAHETDKTMHNTPKNHAQHPPNCRSAKSNTKKKWFPFSVAMFFVTASFHYLEIKTFNNKVDLRLKHILEFNIKFGYLRLAKLHLLVLP